jgi:hypothetical protein
MISLLAVLTLILFAAPGVWAQIVYGQRASADAGFVYNHWSLGDSLEVSQFMVPLNGFIPLQDNLEARFSAANASNKLDLIDEEFKLSGFSDLRLQLNQSLADDRFLLSLGFNLPTGKKKISLLEEWLVLQALSLNFFDFPIRRLGEGFGFNVMAGGAEMLGQVKIGGALMYQYNGKYKPYDIDDEYDPGDQLSVVGSADLSSDDYAISASMVYSTFTTDKLEDRKIFSQAPVFSLHTTGVAGSGSYRFAADVGLLFRGRNAQYDSTEAKIEQLKFYGDEYLLAGRMIWTPDTDWKVTPLAEVRLLGENEYGMESSTVFGFGVEIARNIGTGVDVGMGFKYFTGTVGLGDLDLSGYQITATLLTSFE